MDDIHVLTVMRVWWCLWLQPGQTLGEWMSTAKTNRGISEVDFRLASLWLMANHLVVESEQTYPESTVYKAQRP